MVDRLDSARRRYELLRLTPGEPAVGRKAQETSLWLEQDVCAVVEDLVGRPDFQVQARWPLEQLRAGAAGEERALVGRADASLVQAARQLARLPPHPAALAASL